jgi:hypothetical protein
MGNMFLPVVVLAIFAGLGAIAHDQARSRMPTTATARTQIAGEVFIAYRNALLAYQKSNPGFTGVVPAAAISSSGVQFPQAFLEVAGNEITAFGMAGRTLTVYATVPTGTIAAALRVAENDASLGLASGATWKSFAPLAASVPLVTTVPQGALVSITQTGR